MKGDMVAHSKDPATWYGFEDTRPGNINLRWQRTAHNSQGLSEVWRGGMRPPGCTVVIARPEE